MLRVDILLLLIARCHGVLDKTPDEDDIAAWKARYLEMYDAQIDELEPKGGLHAAQAGSDRGLV